MKKVILAVFVFFAISSCSTLSIGKKGVFYKEMSKEPTVKL
jgi:hypothetical protein